MAEIILDLPKTNVPVNINIEEDSSFVIKFETTDSTPSKDGNDLVFSFGDGQSIRLVDFYETYTSETLPEFKVGDVTLEGVAFLEAFGNEDIMPAAGGTSAPTSGGTTVGLRGGTLLDSIDRIGRLDQEYNDDLDNDELLEGLGVVNNAGVNDAPIILGFVSIPDGNDYTHPGVDADLFVTESGVGRNDSGSLNATHPNRGYDGDLSASGRVIAADADGDTLTFFVAGDGKGVYGDFTIDSNTGVFNFVLNDDAAAQLNQGENFPQSFVIGVSDGNGGVEYKTIVVNTQGTNDIPSLQLYDADYLKALASFNSGNSDFESLEELQDYFLIKDNLEVLQVKEDASKTPDLNDSEVDSGVATSTDDDRDGALGDEPSYFVSSKDAFNHFDNDSAGGDDADNDLALVVNPSGVADDTSVGTSVTGLYGTLTIDPVTGEYTYTLDNDKVQHLGEGERPEDAESFVVYVKDEYGAWDAKEIQVDITGTNDVPIIESAILDLVTDDSYIATDGTNPGGTHEGKDYDRDNPSLTPDGYNDQGQSSSKSDSGAIRFTSAEDMNGGTITIGGEEFKVVENPVGTFNLQAPAGGDFTIENVDGYGQLDVDPKLEYDPATGSFTLNYTYTQTKNFDHAEPNATTDADGSSRLSGVVDEFEVIIKDVKEDAGSTEGAKATISVKIEDDNPAVGTVSYDNGKILFETVAGGSQVTGTVDLDFGADGQHATNAFAWNLDATTGLPLNKNNKPIELQTSDGNDITWSYGTDDNGNVDKSVLIGVDAQGDEVIKLEMNEDTGEYSITLSQGVKHHEPDAGETSDNNMDLDLDGDADKNSPTDDATNLNFGFTITDGDGDSAKGQISVNIKDDTPSAVVDTDLEFDITLETSDADIAPNASASDSATILKLDSNVIGNHVQAGTDGLQSYEVTDYNFTMPNGELTLDGMGITLSLDDNGNIIGKDANGETLFELSVTLGDDGSANVTLTQSQALDHTLTDENGKPVNLDELVLDLEDLEIGLEAKVDVTDKDGDKVNQSVNIGLTGSLTLNDATPDVGIASGATVSETVLSYPNSKNDEGDDGTQTSPNADASTTASGTVPLNFGADGQADTNAFAWDIQTKAGDDTTYTTQPNIWSSDGDKVEWKVDPDNSDVLIGTADGKTILTVTMVKDGDGEYTGEYNVELFESIMHDAPDANLSKDYNTDTDGNGVADEQDADSTNESNTDLNFGFTITDGDGDIAKGQVTVQVEDDVIEVEAKETEVTLQPFGDDNDNSLDLFDGKADASDLQNALTSDGKGFDESDAIDASSPGYKVTYYKNQNDDKSTIKLGEGDTGFTITAALVTRNEDGSTEATSEGLTLVWRDDETVANGDKYGDGIGIISPGGSVNGNLEVGNTEGDYLEGSQAEALIIKLPEGSTAYGVDLGFSCLFTEDGNSSVDAGKGEYIVLEFYRDGELVHTVTQLAGAAGGKEDFDASTVTVPFDEVRIIPSTNGSDFVLNNVDFSNFDKSVIAYGEGELEFKAADGVEAVYFDKITIGESTIEFKDGEIEGDNTIILSDGTELSLIEQGDNGFVAVDKDGGEAYFTVSVDNDGQWVIYQHKPFGDKIDVTFGAKDSDGDYGVLDTPITMTPDDAPSDMKGESSVTLEEKFLDNGTADPHPNQDGDVSSVTKAIELDFGADDPHPNEPFVWNLSKDSDGKNIPTDAEGNEINLKTSDGGEITWGYDGDDKSTLIGKDEQGNEVIKLEMNDDFTEYTVTLSQAVEHDKDAKNDDGTSQDESIDDLNFGFTIQDKDGDTADGQINVIIKDDAPKEEVDSNITIPFKDLVTSDATTENAALVTVLGIQTYIDNSITPQPGADGASTVTKTVNDMNFTLPKGEDSIETSLGDTKVFLTLDENGNIIGKDANDVPLFKVSVTFSEEDGGTASITLEQLQALDHVLTGEDGKPINLEKLELDFKDLGIGLEAKVDVTDNDGDTVSQSINFDLDNSLIFNDDGPSITDVEDSTYDTAGQLIEGDFDILKGADNGEGSSVTVKITIGTNEYNITASENSQTLGNQGAIVFNPDGSYIFTPSVNFDGDMTITATVKDADGDEKTESTTITDNVFGTGNDEDLEGTVESHDDAKVTDKVVTDVTLPTGTSIAGGSYTATTDDGREIGTFEVDENGKLVFTQNEAFDHTNLPGDFSGIVQVPVVDANGDTGNVKVTVTIGDSEPSITDVEDSTYDTAGQLIEGDFDILKGADNGEGSSVTVKITIGANEYNITASENSQTLGNQGAIVFNPDGSYIFTPSVNFDGDMIITATVKDADGDEKTESTTITDNVFGTGNDEDLEGTVESHDDAKATDKVITDVTLPTGTTIENGSYTATTDDGREIGTFEVDENGKLVFTQNEAFVHDEDTDSFTGDVQVPVVDANGDTANVKVTVTIGDSEPNIKFESGGISATHTTYDAMVDGANASGKQPADATATATGSFTINGSDGLASLVIAGLTTVGGDAMNYDLTDPQYADKDGDGYLDVTIYGEHGELSNIKLTRDDETGDYTVEYKYTQTQTTELGTKNNPADYDSDKKVQAEDFKITVVDKDGDDAEGNIKIDIVDDVLVLTDTDTSTTIGTYVEGADGEDGEDGYYSVVTDDTSADHGKVSGTLENLGADGLVSLDINPATYNGTVSHAQNVTVDGQSKELTLILKDGVLYGVEGNKIDNSYDLSDPYFTFTIDDNGKWDFEQLRPFGGNVTINVKGVDADGDSDTYDIVIRGDDNPSLDKDPHVDTSSVTVYESALAQGTNPNSNDEEAQGTIDMNFGVDGQHKDEPFVWNLSENDIPTDSDGKEISLKTSDGGEITWDYSGSDKTTLIGKDADGEEVIRLEMDVDNGEYTVTISQGVEHDKAKGDDTEIDDLNFGFTIQDADGDTANGQVDVVIKDDAPTANSDSNSVTEGDEVMGNVLTNDDKGADVGGEVIQVTPQGSSWTKPVDWEASGDEIAKFTSDYGTVTFNKDGSYTFDSNPDSITTETEFKFDYIMKDADGDNSNNTLTIDVTDSTVDLNIAGDSIILDEAHMSDGTDAKEDGAVVSNQSFTIESAVDLQSITIGNTEINVKNAIEGNNITISQNGFTISNVVIKPVGDTYTVTYDVTLDENYDHDAPNDSITTDERTDPFDVPITATDIYGNKDTGSIKVVIEDDAPTGDQAVEGVLEGNVSSALVEIDFGADDGGNKSLEFGDSTFTYTDGKWTNTTEGVTDPTTGVSTDGKTLTAADGSSLENSSTDLWLAKMQNTSTDDSKTEFSDIKFTDSDGDSSNITITGKESDFGDLIGISGGESNIGSGENYNMVFIFDTSGSMYDDNYNGVITLEDGTKTTRLEAACDALESYVSDVLSAHAEDGIFGGDVNISIVTFWGNVEINLEGKDLSDSTIQDEVIQKINDIRNYNKFGSAIEYTETDGVEGEDFVYGPAITSTKNPDGTVEYSIDTNTQVKYKLDGSGDIMYSTSDIDFHHQTSYLKGFEAATDIIEGLDDTNSTTQVFFLTDGVPYPKTSEVIEKTDEAFEALKGAVGEDGTIHAIGMGAGVSKEFLDSYDTSKDGADIVADKDISKVFELSTGTGSSVSGKTGFGLANEGNDVVIAGISADKLKELLEKEFPDGISDAVLMSFLIQNPQWVDDNIPHDDKRYFISGGDGDDHVNTQDANDIIIGDADQNAMENLADNLNIDTPFNVAELIAKADKTEAEIEQLDNLFDEIANKAKNDPNALNDAAIKLEGEHDGNDTIHSSGGDDILLGLGGNDELHGGDGDDIIIGGSGDDVIYGGSGEDSLYGGTGDDIIYFDLADKIVNGGEGDDIFVLDDPLDNLKLSDVILDGGEGEGIDVLLANADSLEDIDGLFSNDSLTMNNLDVIILSNDIEIAKEFYDNFTIVTNEDGTNGIDGWTEKEGESYTKDGQEFKVFTSNTTSENPDDEVTILVNTTLLNNSST